MERTTALNAALLLGGVVLLVVPLAVGPNVPPDRVEFYVEGDWSDQQGQQNLAYADLSPAEQATFDRALEQSSPVNYTVAEAPEGLTPPANRIDVYNVRYEESWYLLQVKHLTNSADFLTQVFPRLVLGMGGILVGLAAGFREFA
ncbi:MULTISPECIES: hypothetical protein [Salinibaculum]|uniref:hypothetical protein n=1 Tax=Salinibaculum TaxID=2732368 RepID=UPI0030CE7A4D